MRLAGGATADAQAGTGGSSQWAYTAAAAWGGPGEQVGGVAPGDHVFLPGRWRAGASSCRHAVAPLNVFRWEGAPSLCGQKAPRGWLCRGWVGGSRVAARSPNPRLHHQRDGKPLPKAWPGPGNHFCLGFGRKIDNLLLGSGLALEAPGSASPG